MKKFRVAHVINSMGLGGVPAIVYYLLKNLSPERYELYLYGLKGYADHADVREEQAERFRKLGVKIFFPDRDEKKFYVVKELCQWIIRDQVDILHTHSYKPNIYGRLAGILCKDLKIIGHYHNYYDDKWEKDGSLVFDQLLERFSDRLIACSESVRRHVSERVGIPLEKIEMIANGVDLDRFGVQYDIERVKTELGIPLGSKVVGIIGRISEQKAQDDFIKAAKMIHQSVPEAVFLIVGAADDDVLMDRLRRLAVELGIEREVLFIDYVSDIPKIYSVLDVLIVPSRWEGFGLILVEAMAAGKPIVATRVGPIPEVVVSGETALLVPPSSPHCIASEAVFLLQNPDRAREMGQKGRERSKRFSWEKAGMQLDDLYQGLR
ncbi:MAG: glycosyltransferase family 4 protein [Candidatus Tectomicrobia bacterium]|uniref:Glycosyltransferase family 4 protein n=1 Tax=Tectimicrobiota bacterium TaxID=2528274 RepID=A0A932CLP1_UNCTE|nr:glycosyltransferase family 4 protein [Candidatus Tectomicrobia bacterium]